MIRIHWQCAAALSSGIPWALLCGALVWPHSIATAAEATARATAVAHTCVTCHGPEGRSQGAMPSLAGRTAADTLAALQAFRTETRKSTVMHRIARGLSEADMVAVAAYFATLPGH